MSTFSSNLKELRLKKGVLQKNIAQTLGVSKAAYSLYETGAREPSLELLQKLAEYFNVSLDQLIGIEKPNKPSLTITHSTKTPDETRLLTDYRTLNSLGKKEAVKRVNELTCVPAYQQREIILNAAHENNPTPEQKTAADDIMMNDAEWE